MTTIVKKRQKGDKSEVRKRILNKASEAFKVHGIKSVHMDDLAVSLGISKRTIYELFHDKEQLLLEVVMRHREEMRVYVEGIASRAEHVLEVIIAIYRREAEDFKTINPQFFKDMKKYPAVLDKLRDSRKEVDSEAVSYLQKGVEQGIFRADIDFNIIYRVMATQMDIVINSELSDEFPMIDIYDAVIFLHLRGITTERGQRIVDNFFLELKEKRKL